MRVFVLLIFMIFMLISGCSLFLPPAQTVGHIPPSLTSPRIVHGCAVINNQLKLATCYLKTSEALYLANQDKQSLTTLEKKWS
ncbi:hypothetical protein L3V82_12555 [Thiotrichales bacterium 19S3-7]|nr:hypothetical protein [Thiotrichales bacterium 19S3-7]MCF6802775.1 hypothetical protein [Thiotrichales bacterium 19S3-11]